MYLTTDQMLRQKAQHLTAIERQYLREQLTIKGLNSHDHHDTVGDIVFRSFSLKDEIMHRIWQKSQGEVGDGYECQDPWEAMSMTAGGLLDNGQNVLNHIANEWP